MATNKNSDNFIVRSEQELKLILSNNKFLKMAELARTLLNIPKSGFNLENKESAEAFSLWIKKNKKDEFRNIIKTLKKFKTIQSDPYWLLDWINFCVENYHEYDYEYYHKDFFVMECPSLEIYENYLNEKPFAGVFDYILFNKALSPQTNFVSIFQGGSLNGVSQNRYITLAISANTTKRNFMGLWPYINFLQKRMPNYNKGKKRTKKNLENYLKLYKENDKSNYELMEDIYQKDFENTEFLPKKVEQKKAANIRKMKERAKKLIESA